MELIGEIIALFFIGILLYAYAKFVGNKDNT